MMTDRHAYRGCDIVQMGLKACGLTEEIMDGHTGKWTNDQTDTDVTYRLRDRSMGRQTNEQVVGTVSRQ